MEVLKEKVGRLAGNPLQFIIFTIVIGATVCLMATPYYAYAVVPGLGLLFLLFLGKSPRAGYYMIIFMVPFDTYREMIGKVLSVSKIVGVSLVLIVGFNLIFGRIELSRLKSNLWMWFVLYFAVSLISAIFSEFKPTSFNSIRQLVDAYFFFFLTVALVDRDSLFGTLPRVLILSVTLSSVLSIFGYFFNIPFLSMNVESENLTRALGAANDPNFAAAVICFALAFLFHYLFKAKGFGNKLLAFSLISVNVLAIVLTFSRAGGLVLVLVFILVALEQWRKVRVAHLGLLMTAGLLFVTILAVAVPRSYWTRQESLADSSDLSLARRYSYITIGREAVLVKPWFGYGPGTFHDLYAQSLYAAYFAGKDEDDYFRDAHNTYVEILVGRGGIGLAVFLCLLLIAFLKFNAARGRLLRGGYDVEASMVRSYMLALLTISVYFMFLSAEYQKYIWMSLGLAHVASDISKETNLWSS